MLCVLVCCALVGCGLVCCVCWHVMCGARAARNRTGGRVDVLVVWWCRARVPRCLLWGGFCDAADVLSVMPWVL